MSDPIVFQKGPIVQPTEAGTYWYCSCGHSATQPFCDGSHNQTGMAPIKVQIDAKKTVAWCGCKHSKNGAFCDGSHAGL